MKLGINGLGRIGKLTLWHHAARGAFDEIVVNVGREVGSGLDAVCSTIERDSTYGPIHRFLYGVDAEPCVRIVDRERRVLDVAGSRVRITQTDRNPRDLRWGDQGVRLVVDTTGAFSDPTRAPDHRNGALRGHLAAGAEHVINSAAFKPRDGAPTIPDEAATLIYGINHEAFDPRKHRLVSAASCTTTAVAHMLKPLLDAIGPAPLMTAAMSTIHAATNTQRVLDAVPAAGTGDLRKSRSVLDSIVLTSTNATAALELVMPEIKQVGFMGDSVRVPVSTVSLAILNLTFQSTMRSDGTSSFSRERINGVYGDAASGAQKGLLVYSEDQNVPSDVQGMRAAVVIEGRETHTRTGFVDIDLEALGVTAGTRKVHVPVTHAKIFGWYDNEYGSYTNMLGALTMHIASVMGA